MRLDHWSESINLTNWTWEVKDRVKLEWPRAIWLVWEVMLSLSFISNHLYQTSKSLVGWPGLGSGVLGAEAGRGVFTVSFRSTWDLGNTGGITCLGAVIYETRGECSSCLQIVQGDSQKDPKLWRTGPMSDSGGTLEEDWKSHRKSKRSCTCH